MRESGQVFWPVVSDANCKEEQRKKKAEDVAGHQLREDARQRQVDRQAEVKRKEDDSEEVTEREDADRQGDVEDQAEGQEVEEDTAVLKASDRNLTLI